MSKLCKESKNFFIFEISGKKHNLILIFSRIHTLFPVLLFITVYPKTVKTPGNVLCSDVGT